MTVKERQNEVAEHISEIDKQIQSVDQHIAQAHKREDAFCHPVPGLDVTRPKGDEATGTAGQFSS